MATKYQRESAAEPVEATHHRLQDLYMSRKSWPIRRRLLLTYMGLLFFGLLALALHWLNFPEKSDEPQRTIGRILAKEGDPVTGEAFFNLGIALDEGEVYRVKTPVDQDLWSRFKPGDYIGVYCRRDLHRKSLEILELGLVALPAPDR